MSSNFAHWTFTKGTFFIGQLKVDKWIDKKRAGGSNC